MDFDPMDIKPIDDKPTSFVKPDLQPIIEAGMVLLFHYFFQANLH